MTLETGKPIGRIFCETFFFKKTFYLSSLLSLFKYSLLVRPYPFSHVTTKIRLMRPLQEVQDIGQLWPLRNEEYFTVHYGNGNYDGWRLRRLGEFDGSEEFLDLYDLGRLPLWNLADYWSCQYPRSRCVGERPEHGAWELKAFVKKTLRQQISIMEDSSWQWLGQKHGYPWCHRRWCYCHRAELRMHFLKMDLMEEGWWSTY